MNKNVHAEWADNVDPRLRLVPSRYNTLRYLHRLRYNTLRYLHRLRYNTLRYLHRLRYNTLRYLHRLRYNTLRYLHRLRYNTLRYLHRLRYNTLRYLHRLRYNTLRYIHRLRYNTLIDGQTDLKYGWMFQTAVYPYFLPHSHHHPLCLHLLLINLATTQDAVQTTALNNSNKLELLGLYENINARVDKKATILKITKKQQS